MITAFAVRLERHQTSRSVERKPSDHGILRDRNSPCDGEATYDQLISPTLALGVPVVDRVRNSKQAQLGRSRELRAAGRTWAEIGVVFRREYGVNARVALRLAHGWSQREAADRWNERWPDDPKTFKNISYWEQWPASTGYAPSLDVLARLAELYGCHIADLVADGADHRQSDSLYQGRSDLAQLPTAVAGALQPEQNGLPGATGRGNDQLAAFVARLEETEVNELARQISVWATQLDSGIDRRSLLLKLGFALTMAAAMPAGAVEEAAVPLLPQVEPSGLSGIWRSQYSYYSSGRGQQFSSVHYVIIRQRARQLTIASLPHSTGSELELSLAVDGPTVTGSWEERTSPNGYYKGAIYRGAVQLLLDPSGGCMTGKWLGFGKRFEINTGDWELTLETRSLSRRSISEYRLKA